MALNTFKGVNCNWAVGNTSYSLQGGVLQTKDNSGQTDTGTIQNELGNVIGVQYYNPTQEATLDFVLTGSGTTGAVTVPAKPDFGTAISVTDSTNSNITGSLTGIGAWLFEGWREQGSNTSALKLSFTLKRYMGMTV